MSQKAINSETTNKEPNNTPKQHPPNNNALPLLQNQAKTQNQKSPSTNPLQTSTIQQIQSQKSTIVHQLRRIKQTIDSVREDQRSKSILRKRQEIAYDKKAQRLAVSFVAQQKIKKQKMLERRIKHEEKSKALLKKVAEEDNKTRQQLQSMLREQKRRTIANRMNQSKSRREELKSIQKQTNCLINKLIKEEARLRKKAQSPEHSFERKIKFVQRRPHVDFAAVTKHEKEYLKSKDQLSSSKKQRSISISYPTKRFQKNRWAYKLEEEDNKLKEQERLRQLDRRIRLQKKAKYGQIITSLFVKRNRAAQTEDQQTEVKPKSKSIYVMPLTKMPRAGKMKTEQSQNMQSNSLRLKKIINSHYTSIRKEDRLKSPEDKKRVEKERKLRRQTSQRLKKMDSQILQKTASEPQSKYQSNYQNYLGLVKPKKKQDDNAWNGILSNNGLTHEQKFLQLMRNAKTLQNKAKLKEEFKEKSDEVVDLYLGSIQAKLAILESI